jgi:hypothetical protein
MIENRRYYNPQLKTHLIFIWYGTAPTRMRQDFDHFPFRRLCDMFDPSCQSRIPEMFDTFTIGKIVENVTISFNPHFLLMNWAATTLTTGQNLMANLCITKW